MITASSAASEGATVNAVIASAPMAAQSERRLNGLGDMGASFWAQRISKARRKKVSLERQQRSAIDLCRLPKIRGKAGIVTAGRTRVRE
jgi:hypothetical protein